MTPRETHAQIERWLLSLPGVLASGVAEVDGQDTVCIGHDAQLSNAERAVILDRFQGCNVLFLQKQS
jgi:hypothetical protein